MRKAIYQKLLAVPFRVAGASAWLAGFMGSVWPEKVKAMIGGDAVTIQGLGITLLALSSIYFCLLWALKPGEKPGAMPLQPSLGPQSQSYGKVEGGVHNHYVSTGGFGLTAPILQRPMSVIRGLHVHGNRGDGISIEGGVPVHIEDAVVENSGGHGIYIGPKKERDEDDPAK